VVDALGIPLRLPVHREDLSEDDAAQLVRGLPAGTDVVVITYETSPAEIVALCRHVGCGAAQVHAEVPAATLQALRSARAELRIFKSVVVAQDSAASLERQAVQLAPWVDAFITDTYDPRTGASGATGLTHDRAISRRLVERSSVPVILAGGLGPYNVAEAIATCAPAGVDAHTGLGGADGRKDPELVRRFVQEARDAWAKR
jgi:phosphoribosylanthranilate isomerase